MIVFLTGITGLVGSHTAVELLAAGHSVAALARGRNGVSAEQRVRRILEAHPAYGARFNLTGLHVVEGELLDPDRGIAGDAIETLKGHVEVVVHGAGDVAFSTHAEASSAHTNLDIAQRVAALAVELGCGRLVHVSTAYAAPHPGRTPFRTPYEEDKALAESWLRETAEPRDGLVVSLVRPSIVTGDATHGFTPTYHGIYPFLIYVAQYAEELKRARASACIPRGLKPDGRVNLVPADYVAAVIREVASRPATAAREFNVINPTPWRVLDLARLVGRHVGITEELFTRPTDGSGPLSTAASHMVRMLRDTYAPYFDVDLDLDTASTRHLAEAGGIPPVENRPEWILALLRWGLRREWKEFC